MKKTKKIFGIMLFPVVALSVSVMAAINGHSRENTLKADEPVHSHENMSACDSLPTSAGSYYLTQDIVISNSWSVPSGVVNLCLNGHSITNIGDSNNVIYVDGSSTVLNLYDCGEDVHYYYIDENYLGVVVNTLEEAQAGNPERNGSFTGGYITGGRGCNYENAYRGGCMLVNNGAKFNFYGGTLIGNRTRSDSKYGNGGAIWSRFGNVTIHDGASIIGNCASSCGAMCTNFDGNNGTLTMDGGLFADNTGLADCGALSVGGPTSITGGRFFRNYCLDTLSGGGAISVAEAPGRVHIGGNVEITENRAIAFGGGINVFGVDKGWTIDSGSLSISGSLKVFNNLAKHNGDSYVVDNLYLMSEKNKYYSSGEMLILEGQLEEDANIGIGLDSGGGLIVKNWTGIMNDADPSKYFFSDIDGSVLSVDTDGSLKLVSVFAAVSKDDDIQYYGDLSSALAAWNDGSTLTLYKDIEGQIVMADGDKTLDLNNHVLSYANGTVITVNGGTLHVVDNSEVKTKHYFVPQNESCAVLSDTPTDYSFEGGYITGVNTTGGRGIHINGGDVIISSGTVFGNKGGGGGGVSVAEGSNLTIEGTGGVIGNYGGGEYSSCGGISLNGSLTMTGGFVNYNSAYLGIGGVGVRGNNSSFTMTGGEIVGNYCRTWLAAGVHVDGNHPCSIGGSAKIYGNHYLTSEKNLGFNTDNPIKIISPLTKDASIHIFPCLDKDDNNQGKATFDNPITFTQNWSEMMGDADPFNYFKCDPIYKRNLNDSSALTNEYDIYLRDGEAKASPVSYIVRFNAGLGTGSMLDDTASHRLYVLPDNEFIAPEGKRFIGWKCSDNEKLYSAGESVVLSGDTTFEAQWVKDAEEDWLSLSGTIYLEDGVTPAAGAHVKLFKGNQLFDFAVANEQGGYQFECPNGFFNIVVEYDDLSKTVLVEVNDATIENIVLSNGNTESILNVNSDSEITVGSLDKEAEDVREKEGVSDNQYVAISMNIEAKEAKEAENADKIVEAEPEKELDFFEVKVEKTIDEETTTLDETNNVIEIIVPYENINRREIVVYSYHNGEVRIFEESDTKADGTYIVDKENALIKIYTNKFSTFAIGYTPYFRLNASITLGSYDGLVTASLKNLGTNEVITLTDVTLENVIFEDLKKGDYLLTITWVDGATNSITMPITIS